MVAIYNIPHLVPAASAVTLLAEAPVVHTPGPWRVAMLVAARHKSTLAIEAANERLLQHAPDLVAAIQAALGQLRTAGAGQGGADLGQARATLINALALAAPGTLYGLPR